MRLSKALRLGNVPSVAFAGAGGKTTAIFQLAQEYDSCIITTTTHLGLWQVHQNGNHIIWESNQSFSEANLSIGKGTTIITGKAEGDRYCGLDEQQITVLGDFASTHGMPLFIEADGARQKPLKAPAPHEPAIPNFVDTVVVLAGISAVGKKLNKEYVHRPEVFSQLSNLGEDSLITVEAIGKALSHPEGGLKNIPKSSRKVALINQADTLQLQSLAKNLAQQVLPHFDAVAIAALNPNQTDEPMGQSIHAVYEQIAGIVLAAGGSSRYGQSKQLLQYHGKPFIRVVAETALSAGLYPVIVVTGANGKEAERALEGLKVQIVRNPDWQNGQSASIRAGLEKLSRSIGGTIFLLVDQPQVTKSVLKALMEGHYKDLPSVLAPYILDRRANPVFFDQVTFEDLMKLEGDQGGRAIFSKFPPSYMNWADENLLLDVDTPEDYQRLLDIDHGA